MECCKTEETQGNEKSLPLDKIPLLTNEFALLLSDWVMNKLQASLSSNQINSTKSIHKCSEIAYQLHSADPKSDWLLPQKFEWMHPKYIHMCQKWL